MRTFILLALLLSSSLGSDSRRGGIPSATPGDDIFMQGTYLEWSVNPGSVFGNRDSVSGLSYGGSEVPSGYHNNVAGRLGVVVDYDLNGFGQGNPPHSGDLFAQGYNDIGFHVSFNGASGLEAFNNMPLLNDDDDADTSFTPYRGCISCSKGDRADSCQPLDEDCSCNLDIEAASYICPFKRWDLTTSSFTDTSNASVFSTVWVGVARATTFKGDKSGQLTPTGEEVTITKTTWSRRSDLAIYEYCDVSNTGTEDVTSVNLFWTVVPTLEAFDHAGFGHNASTDFANYFSIPHQPNGDISDNRVLAKSRGQWYNMTVALGAGDQNARAWTQNANTWRQAARPYSGQVAVNANQAKATTEVLEERVMGLNIRIPVLNVGQTASKKMFWAFHPSAINAAYIEIGAINPENPITTRAVTSAPITSAAVTSSPITSSAIPVATTGDVLSGVVPPSNLVSDDGNGNNDSIKIIASIFGVAGFILVVLAVGGIILAVKRLRANPVA